MFRDLFKSTKDIEQDKRHRRRRALRNADRQIEALSVNVQKLENERDGFWQKAVKAKASGQVDSAKMALRSVQAKDQMRLTLERRLFSFDVIRQRLEYSANDREMIDALTSLAAEVDVSADELETALEDTLGAKLDEIGASDRILERHGDRTSLAMNHAAESSMQQLEAQLDAAVATVIGGSGAASVGAVESHAQTGAKKIEKALGKDA